MGAAELRKQLLERTVDWATGQDDIRTLLVVGSMARSEMPADEWSDIDVVIVSEEPEKYLRNADWLLPIGNYILTFLETTAVGGGKERRVMFEGGVDVDFSVFPASIFKGMLEVEEIKEVLSRGVKILLDKDGEVQELLSNLAYTPPAVKPSVEEWDNEVHDFFYHVIWSVKKLRRGELFVAKSCMDNYLQRQLRTMLRWHAAGCRGEEYETWHKTRFMEKWGDPSFIQRWEKTYSLLEKEGMAKALLAALDLYRDMAKETAQFLNLPYPDEADKGTLSLLEKYLSGDHQLSSF